MIFRAFILLFVTLTLSACMGGSGQKGPFNAGSDVTLSQLDNQAAVIDTTTMTAKVIGQQGDYSINRIPWNGWAQLQITGQYFDEYANGDSSTVLTLDAITKKDRRFDTANAHIFSHLAAARIRQLVANGKNLSNAWKDAQKEMKRLFDLKRVSANIHRGVEQLDMLNGTGQFRKDNANLLLFSGSFMATGGDAASLQLLSTDFADDGKINGVAAGVFHAIAVKAGTAGLLNLLSDNLKQHGSRNPPNSGDMTKLPKWVIVGEDGDTTPPVITLLGDNPVDVEVGAEVYQDAGATATDDVDGEVSTSISSNNVNTSVLGEYTISYTASDSAGNTASASRTVNVVDTTPPVITLLGDNPLILTVDNNEVPAPFQDPGAQVTDNYDNELDYQVDPGVVDTANIGVYTLTYTATDSSGNAAAPVTRQIEVVAAPNHAPVATAQSITIDEDSPASTVTLTGSDADGDAISYVLTSQPAHGVLSGTAPNLAYTPNANYFGADSFSFKVNDGLADSAVATVSITVNSVNDLPIANAGPDTTIQINHAVALNGAGSDIEGPVTYSWSENGSTLATTASFSYTPNTEGAHTLTLTVSDTDGASATDTVVVTATPVPNVAPTANAGPDVSTQVNTPVSLNGSGADTDGTIVAYSWSENGAQLATTASFDYTPTTAGAHTLTLSVTDNDGASTSDTVIVQADLPAPYQIIFITPITEVPQGLDAAQFAVGIDLIYSIVDGDSNPVADAIASFDLSVVDLNTPGDYPLVFNYTDPFGRLVSNMLTVRVKGAAPVANAQSVTVDEDSNNNPITLSGSDANGDALTYSVATQPAHGLLTGTAPNLSYTPNANYHGEDSFTFTVNDGNASSPAATVSITVTSINDAPSANAGSDVATQVNTPIMLSGSGADIDGTIVSYSWSENGVTLATTASFDYMPTTAGAHTLTLTVSDNDGATASDTVVVTVTAVPNVAPTANAGADTSTQVNSPVTLTGSGADADGTIASYSWTENGNVLATTASFDYTPNTEGAHTLTLTVTDNDGATGSDTVLVQATLPGLYQITFTHNPLHVNEDHADIVLFNAILPRNVELLDADGNSVSDTVSVDTSSVDPATPGVYPLVYSYTDAFNRTITANLSLVIDDITPPVITLIGGDVSLQVGDNYQDAGASATDNVDANITVNVDNPIDTTTPGAYTVTYTATDSAGNSALPVTRSVTVTDVVAGYNCPATLISEQSFSDDFVSNAEADTPWPQPYSPLSVIDIENAFNAARENDALNVQGQKLKMPPQSIWDSYSDSQKALFLVNSERCARGIRPYEGIDPGVEASPAQIYAELLANAGNGLSHTADGRTPFERMAQDANAVVGSTADFFNYGENLAFSGVASTGSYPNLYEPVAKAVYAWLYDDKADTGGSYGHRKFILATGLVENSGVNNKEGLIGIGVATQQFIDNTQTQTYYWTRVYTVMNGFDPNENWDMSNVESVGLIQPSSCLSGYVGFFDNAGHFSCAPAPQ